MLTRVLLLAVVATTLPSSALFAFAGAQGEGKPTSIVIQQFPAWTKVPIVITTAKIQGQEVEAGVTFNASDEWIRHLSVVVKNVSAVDLAGVSVTVEFARSAEDEPLLPNLNMSAGKDYVSVQNNPGKDLALKPGDSVELSLSAAWYGALEYELKHRDGLPSTILRRATITPLMASFSQDRVWLRGNYMMRDAENPNRWVPEPTEQKRMTSSVLRAAPFKLVNVAYGRLPACYRWKDNYFQWCTGTGCTKCSVSPDNLAEVQTEGFKRKSIIMQCVKLINGELVPCTGCTMTAWTTDYFQPCF